MKMTLNISRCTALAALLAVTGCGPGKQNEMGTTGDSTNAWAEPKSEMGTPAKATALPTNTLVAVQKQEFIATAQATLSRLDSGISNLVHKSEAYAGATRTNADQALAELGGQREKVEAQFELVKSAVAEGWNEAKSGFVSAMAALQTKHDNAADKFRQFDAEQLQGSTGALNATNQNPN
jgi:hypothetical protein